ncbi:GNAT family N-acetyltransferase [Geodermatophilus sp. SYSU D00697]
MADPDARPPAPARPRGVTVAHTAQLPEDLLAAARTLLDEAFEGDFTDEDWEHALGGVHALVLDGGRLVGHGAVVQRRLVHRGRALRVGYVEAVAVPAAHRRRGVASAVMDQLEAVVRRAYDAGALSATDDGAALYAARGWQAWRGPTAVLTPEGLRRTPDDDGSVYVLPGPAPLDLDGELACDWRDGDPW